MKIQIKMVLSFLFQVVIFPYGTKNRVHTKGAQVIVLGEFTSESLTMKI